MTSALANPAAGQQTVDWELDYYSRPILDADGKKRWELLICSTPIPGEELEPFRLAVSCPSTNVN
jgi:hypothetical protein